MLLQIKTIVFSGNKLFLPLFIFLVLDHITGICVAIKNHKLSSSVGFKGVTTKAMIFVVVFLAWVIDQFILEVDTVTENLVLLFYLSNEGISIIENIRKLGVPVPDKIARVIADISICNCSNDENPK